MLRLPVDVSAYLQQYLLADEIARVCIADHCEPELLHELGALEHTRSELGSHLLYEAVWGNEGNALQRAAYNYSWPDCGDLDI